ncbi:hypothetical protein [Nodosilinea nodulosa]|uniref:hypothetical protein n=1 Tax=Nodosilinea nodulosa TaxID=416001 RepID=UPI00037E7DDF|nr:hypothetical protein [Nodosilinea nodulosa]
MSFCVEIWNVLHDGSIVAFRGEHPGNLSVKVEIRYLCEALATGSKFLWVHLLGCTDVAYTPFENSNLVVDFKSLGNGELEILSAKGEDSHISICCTEGILRLSYVDATCELDNGVPVTFATLSEVRKKYWDDWEQRGKNDV